jgi:predicted dienelactone hydrolase
LQVLCPAQAIEELRLKLPLVDLSIMARLSELQSADALWAGSSDLAELNRATNGRYASDLKELFSIPLPLSPKHSSDGALASQALVLLRSLVDVDSNQAASLEIDTLLASLNQSQASAETPTLLQLLQQLPGRSLTLRLDRALPVLKRQRQMVESLVQKTQSLPSLPAAEASALAPGPLPISVEVVSIPAAEALDEPLDVTVVRPKGTPILPTTLISHGLWDSPNSFMGWAQHLASHGAVVMLPRHRGSDQNQQAAMLNGQAPPPNPEEFLRRPREIKAVIDALEVGNLPGSSDAPRSNLVLIGHSWGATSALQLAGARSVASPAWDACQQVDAPQRNLSWVLQCSFLPAAEPISLLDPRISRVVAVSPPQALVFAAGLANLSLPVLLVSGSHDLVVPGTSEALQPFANYGGKGHRLVLVDGGSHFNLPAKADSNGGPLRALLLRWLEGDAITSSSAVSDPAGMSLRLVNKP